MMEFGAFCDAEFGSAAGEASLAVVFAGCLSSISESRVSWKGATADLAIGRWTCGMVRAAHPCSANANARAQARLMGTGGVLPSIALRHCVLAGSERTPISRRLASIRARASAFSCIGCTAVTGAGTGVGVVERTGMANFATDDAPITDAGLAAATAWLGIGGLIPNVTNIP